MPYDDFREGFAFDEHVRVKLTDGEPTGTILGMGIRSAAEVVKPEKRDGLQAHSAVKGALSPHSEWHTGVAECTAPTANLLEVGGDDSPDSNHAATRFCLIRDWPGTVSRPSGIC